MAAQQTQHAKRLIKSNSLHPSLGGIVSFSARLLIKSGCCFLSGMSRALLFIHAVFLVALFSAVVNSEKAFAESLLLIQYEKLKPELEQSIFGSPIVLNSDTSKHHAQGDVFAVLETPIREVQQTLSQAAHWCELAILHINIKACTYRSHPESQRLKIYLGRKYYQTPSQAYPLKYTFDQLQNSDNHLYVKLTAGDGPFGTHDYQISLEAVPLDEQHSFIHFQYRYQFGFMARMAMNTYLATIGHKKVGFTIDGKDLEGNPAYVKGVQGVVERNVMRYIYAIQSLLDARKSSPANHQQQSFNNWYTHISKHPLQLVEFTREEYLDRKKQEIKNQLTLQAKGETVEETLNETFQ